MKWGGRGGGKKSGKTQTKIKKQITGIDKELNKFKDLQLSQVTCILCASLRVYILKLREW